MRPVGTSKSLYRSLATQRAVAAFGGTANSCVVRIAAYRISLTCVIVQARKQSIIEANDIASPRQAANLSRLIIAVKPGHTSHH